MMIYFNNVIDETRHWNIKDGAYNYSLGDNMGMGVLVYLVGEDLFIEFVPTKFYDECISEMIDNDSITNWWIFDAYDYFNRGIRTLIIFMFDNNCFDDEYWLNNLNDIAVDYNNNDKHLKLDNILYKL